MSEAMFDRVKCWCGVTGTYDEMFSDDLEQLCAGTCVLICRCGGDSCACHYHGSADCGGCDDCEPDDTSST